MNDTALTLYYDGKCPFCLAEMTRLARWDRARDGVLAFTDIAQPGFDPSHLGAGMADLNAQLYALGRDGRVLVGVDSMLAAYTLAGRGYLVWPLRVPLLRGLLSFLYRAFARHRYTMSRVLGYKSACTGDVCTPGNPFLTKRSKP
jgi:predicted DCC family thiol-disulfide oxidoreductase YuxK